LPYPNHPKGCPKYGHPKCAPNLPQIADVLNLKNPVYIAFSEFNLEAHARKMKEKHPHWTERQCKNVLYWQNTSRKWMRERARCAKILTGADTIIECPEGMGVNVYSTCIVAGLKLEKIKDLKICRHVALIGYRGR
jgi:hypothetical protein